MARHNLPSEIKAQEIAIFVSKRRSSPESLIFDGDNKEPHDMVLEFRIQPGIPDVRGWEFVAAVMI